MATPKMKSLHIFHHTDLNNGVDRTCYTLISALRELGSDPHVIVPGEGSLAEVLSRSGFTWEVMALSCCIGPAWRAQLRFLSEAGERSRRLEDLLKKERFDVVHLNTGHLFDAALAAASVGVPVVWHIHSPFEIDYERYARFLSPEGYAWILGTLGSQVVAVSDDIRGSLCKYLNPVQVHTVYNGIDVQELNDRANTERSNIRTELNLSDDARLVLGVGRISAQKDFATFARVAQQVAAEVENAYFIIVGPPEDTQLGQALKAQIETAGLTGRVFILGPRGDVPRLMSQSNVFLSTAIYEGHPLTTLEAMALKRPVVAMACVGLRECVREGVDGLLVPLGDITAAASAVIRVLRDDSLAEALGIAGRHTVLHRFSSGTYAEQFLEVANIAINYGAPRVALGVIDMIRGLLGEISRASARIDELDVDRSFSSRLYSHVRRVLTPSKVTRQ